MRSGMANVWPLLLWLLRKLIELPRRMLIEGVWRLLIAAERMAKLTIEERFVAKSPPQSLADVGLHPGDEIVAHVTVGFTRPVAWPATVRSATCVRWASMPSVDKDRFGAPYDGHIEFRLTHALGRTIYDCDEKLYYRWHRQPATAESGSGDGLFELPEQEQPEAIRCGVVSRVLISWLARSLLVVLLAGLAWAIRAAAPLCLLVLEPMLFKPLTSLLVVLATRFVAVVLPRVIKRLCDEADDEPEVFQFVNVDDEIEIAEME